MIQEIETGKYSRNQAMKHECIKGSETVRSVSYFCGGKS
ncbi:hypothetical protein LEP1GSC193_1423 [Leptospira alstonii serovar Pingchang str. 80-412]|uniref:Uncharacterized protein n=2 Tax=Leptospira alstonii TaxID=28452 RepID=M6CIU1_9LEPT|nr:hypothetical protein LEP1GSC194_0617 [Leptospira alstonii serovar Sichuan str. 79601]EQA81787.1 hypothetical protein LEP1GSC193_1423 [Leptospira alstonii serovar Pingchang str. 80-412]